MVENEKRKDDVTWVKIITLLLDLFDTETHTHNVWFYVVIVVVSHSTSFKLGAKPPLRISNLKRPFLSRSLLTIAADSFPPLSPSSSFTLTPYTPLAVFGRLHASTNHFKLHWLWSEWRQCRKITMH